MPLPPRGWWHRRPAASRGHHHPPPPALSPSPLLGESCCEHPCVGANELGRLSYGRPWTFSPRTLFFRCPTSVRDEARTVGGYLQSQALAMSSSVSSRSPLTESGSCIRHPRAPEARKSARKADSLPRPGLPSIAQLSRYAQARLTMDCSTISQWDSQSTDISWGADCSVVCLPPSEHSYRRYGRHQKYSSNPS